MWDFTKKYFHLNSSAVYNNSAKNMNKHVYCKGRPFIRLDSGLFPQKKFPGCILKRNCSAGIFHHQYVSISFHLTNPDIFSNSSKICHCACTEKVLTRENNFSAWSFKGVSLQHVHNLEMKILLPFSMHSTASKGKNNNPKDKLPPCCRSINDKYCNK